MKRQSERKAPVPAGVQREVSSHVPRSGSNFNDAWDNMMPLWT